MKRGESSGGGQSSLGYLFGSDQQPNASPASPVVYKPPWGDDNSTERAPIVSAPSSKSNRSNNYPRAHGQNVGNIITERPTTKVQSVPGGDSSLGYLFGEK
ncbi:protein SPIRAL1-like 5 isoform X1 [Macadamia integrifolia]|uniref:protein SPIRAL1-like 5 isoform X1 n=1 Tax=Macadamia integrifolia TaxID=60698 RepID=UPI001C52B439|nr:protein SPIRAL1-like 5 isoform X1 [Macadamia integrifolia]